MDCKKEKLAALQVRCREAGLKSTPQRTEILRILAGTDEHPDAETVYLQVRQRLPTISLDTVYRMLRRLEDHGIITRVGAVRDRARFDSNTDRHHHFICTRCGRIIDLEPERIGEVAVPASLSELGRVELVYVELRGVCRACRGTTE